MASHFGIAILINHVRSHSSRSSGSIAGAPVYAVVGVIDVGDNDWATSIVDYVTYLSVLLATEKSRRVASRDMILRPSTDAERRCQDIETANDKDPKRAICIANFALDMIFCGSR